MDRARLDRIATAVAAEPRVALGLLLEACIELLPVAGASVALVHDGQHQGSLASAGAPAVLVDELQFDLGEGPTLVAQATPGPVLEADLALATALWPAFAPAAVALGVAAAFAFPLRVGTVSLGVLSLYGEVAADLDGVDLADAIAISRIATHLLLALERDLPPGFVPERMADVLDDRAVVHQATGMVAAQLGTDVAAALGRLRAHAWSHDRTVGEIAGEVVARRLRFGDEPSAR